MKKILQHKITLQLVVCIITGLFGGLDNLAHAGVLDDIQPGYWYEAPNSHMNSVIPTYTQNLNTFYSIMSAWNGGAYDTKRDRLLIWGGGHMDYGGNELYAFDINTLTWQRLTNPSPTTLKGQTLNTLDSNCIQTVFDLNCDNTPVSKHSYAGLVYLPNTDQLFQYGGSRWYTGGVDAHAWVFDFATNTWIQKTDASGTSLTPISTYNPANGHMLSESGTGAHVQEFNPINNTWTIVGTTGDSSFGGVGDIDTNRNKFMVLEHGYLYVYDLNSPGKNGYTRSIVPTYGDNEIVALAKSDGAAPGFVYDPIIDKMVAWSGAMSQDTTNGLGDTVYVLDLNTLVWKKFTPPTDSVAAPPKGITQSYYPRGTMGRWRYIPSKNIFIGVNDVYDDVFFYRLPAAAANPFAKDATAPAAPSNLNVN